MLFRKRRSRQMIDEELLKTLENVKQEWLMRRALIDKSIEPSYELVYELKLTKAKYLFLLKEAKTRKLSLKP